MQNDAIYNTKLAMLVFSYQRMVALNLSLAEKSLTGDEILPDAQPMKIEAISG